MRTKARRNPARDESIYEGLALIAKRNGADMVGRSMVALDDGKGRKLWLTYEPDKAKRWENADGPFWIRALHYDSETMKQAKIDRNVFARNIDDAEEMFKHFRQRLWPQRGYAKRRFEEIGRRNPIASDPTRLAPNGAPIRKLLDRCRLKPMTIYGALVHYGPKTPKGVSLTILGNTAMRWSARQKRFIRWPSKLTIAPGRSVLLLYPYNVPVLYLNRGDGLLEIYEVERR